MKWFEVTGDEPHYPEMVKHLGSKKLFVTGYSELSENDIQPDRDYCEAMEEWEFDLFANGVKEETLSILAPSTNVPDELIIVTDEDGEKVLRFQCEGCPPYFVKTI